MVQTPYVADNGLEFQTLTSLPPGVNGTTLLPYQVSTLPAELQSQVLPRQIFLFMCACVHLHGFMYITCVYVHRGQTAPNLLGLASQAVFETPGVGVETKHKP